MGYGVIRINNNAPLLRQDGVLRSNTQSTILVKMDVVRMSKLKEPSDKLKHIFEKTIELLDFYKPSELSIEAPFYGKNIQSMLKLGRAQGVAIAAALHRNVPVFEYSPRKIKQSITGNGNASKEQVAAMLKTILKLNERNNTALDATDAVAVALCHYFQRNKFGSAKNGAGAGKSSSWKSFVSLNPERVKGRY